MHKGQRAIGWHPVGVEGVVFRPGDDVAWTTYSRSTPGVPGRRPPPHHRIGLRARHPHKLGRTVGGFAFIM